MTSDTSGPLADASALGLLAAALGGPGRAPAPVERWNPPDCGTIDIRIAADGGWFYGGSPIGRPALVRLFASVLRRDPERYVLVTPVERLGIAVDDLPFCAVEMAVTGEGASRQLAFRTNLDDLVSVGPEHPLRFDLARDGGLKPAVKVRGGLWARVTRAVTYDLLDLADEGADAVVLRVGGTAYVLPHAGPAADTGAAAPSGAA